MKKFILLPLLLVCFSGPLCAQSWNLHIEKQSGNHKVKTLKLKPGYTMEIGRFVSGNDSVNESRYYNGKFWSGSTDSLVLRMNSMKSVSFSKSGPTLTRNIPAAVTGIPFGPDTTLKFALNDIDYLFYSKNANSKFDPTLPLLLGSIAAMIAAPVISYDFKNHEMNTKRLQYWGLGSTIGVVCGFSCIFIVPQRNHHAYRFRTGWPNSFGSEWKFR